MKKFYSITLILSILLTAHASDVTLDKSRSKLSIRGTSTLHDWESIVEEYSVDVKKDDNSFVDLVFRVEVNSIKSGKPLMDKNTYKALKASDYPSIAFESRELTISENTITGNGILIIAGESNVIPVSLKLTDHVRGLNVSGEISFKMTDFNIQPPKALMGTIKTGDELTIVIDLTLDKIVTSTL